MACPIINAPFKKRLYTIQLTPNDWYSSDITLDDMTTESDETLITEDNYILTTVTQMSSHANTNSYGVVIGTESGNYLGTENGSMLGVEGIELTYYYADISYFCSNTVNSKLEISLSDSDKIKCYQDEIIAFIPMNDNGTLKILSLGNKPTQNITIQCEIDEIHFMIGTAHEELSLLTQEQLGSMTHGELGVS